MVPAHDAAHSVAIIGVSCRFPGAHDKEAFWALLREGRDAIVEIDSRRWPTAAVGGDSSPRWAGLIDGVDEFDAEFFQVSPREALQMDPQQRLLLQEAWHCLEEAGVAPSELRRARTAVFAGTMAADYRQRLLGSDTAVESFSYLGNAGAMLANRISHCLGLTGESKTIDAACASSLVALHDARRTLERGEADYAFVAAANVICHPWKHDSFARAHMLSATGRCRTFSDEADGYVPGEGAAVLLLQRVADARHSGHRIHGIIRGSAVNHCGASPTITSPSIAAQRDVVRAALASAALPATAISYVEAHGTGTSLGDPIEIEALRQAFAGSEDTQPRRARSPHSAVPNETLDHAPTGTRQHCTIGAVKSNIGHLEAAAGLAGIIKVLLMFRERQIPPSLHCARPNPIIDFARTPFALAMALQPWPGIVAEHGEPGPSGASDVVRTPRRAGVSSFGFGGVNAHVILEEPPASTLVPTTAGEPTAGGASRALPFILSAHSESALRHLINAWRTYATSDAFPRTDLAAVCLTLACGREHLAWRVGGMVRSHEEIRQMLDRAVPVRSTGDGPGLVFGSHPVSAAALQRWLDADPAVAKAYEENRAAWGPIHSDALKAAGSLAFLCALGQRLRALGVEPGWVSGEGDGRYVALVCAGAISMPEAWRLACGGGVSTAVVRPSCAVYGLGAEPLLPAPISSELLLAACAGTVSSHALRRYLAMAEQLLASQPTFARFMREWAAPLGLADISAALRAALHRDPAAAIGDEQSDLRLFVVIHACLRRLSRKWELPDVDIHPSGAALLTELLVANAITPTQFAALFAPQTDLAAIANAANAKLARLSGAALEKIAPHVPPRNVSLALSDASAARHPGGFAVQIGMPSGAATTDASLGSITLEVEALASPAETWFIGLLALWRRGVAVEWSQVFPDASFTPVSLPAYPFERKSYWVGSGRGSEATEAKIEKPASVLPKISLKTPGPVSARPLLPLTTVGGSGNAAAEPSNAPAAVKRDEPAASPVRIMRAPSTSDVANADAVLPWSVADGIATVRLAERSEHNCFTDALIAAFATRLAQITADSAIKAVVITNDGPHFCAGGTAEFIDQLRRGERAFTDLRPFYRGLLECPVPVLNAVAGHAFGGGLAFALFADVVVLAAESRYSANFLSLGFSPGMGSTLIVPEKLGPDVAARLLYSGQTFSGRELAQAGARVQVIEKAGVLAVALELARDFARQSRVALEVLKHQMAAPLLARLDDYEARELAGHERTLVDQAALPAPPSLSHRNLLPPAISTTTARQSARPRSTAPSSGGLISDLQEIAGKLLLMRPGDVDPAKAFRELGMDSVLTVELAKAVSRRWSIAVDAAVLYEFPSVARLAQHLQSLVVPTPVPPAHSAEIPTSSPLSTAPIDGVAVIGMAARYPCADDLDAFWRNLVSGVDAVTTIPTERWDADAYYDANPDAPGKTNSRWGGFLRDIEQFDPLFFKISPSEAEAMDPQQRLFLQEAWHALEHAGYGGLREARCGVFVGVSAGDYAEHLARAGRGDSAEAFMGLAPSILASRISYLLDLRGPSLAIDTACSSSLVAVHQACQSLRQGDCDMALAGGVTLMTTPQLHVRTGHAHMLSPTGRSRPFGADADGIVLGEGVGVVVLKPLARAIADGDTVYAVIRGSGINQDGATNGITAPSARAQEELIRAVLVRADVTADSIQYVEAHGTGTPLGDPIELRALASVFGSRGSPSIPPASAQRIALGSVKSNIGHTVCAAGVGGLIKTVLALRHDEIPPSLHFGTGNPRVNFADTPFIVPTVPTPWPETATPRRAAVSSFGFSGTNAHLVLEAYPPAARAVAATPHDRPLRFTLSAQTGAGLRRYVEAWRRFLAQSDEALPKLADICFTLASGRARFAHEISFAVRDLAALRAALDAFVRGETPRDEGAVAELPSRGCRVALPLYPFERVRCWAALAPASVSGEGRITAFADWTEPRPPARPTDPLEQLLERVSRQDLSIDAAELEIVRQELLSR